MDLCFDTLIFFRLLAKQESVKCKVTLAIAASFFGISYALVLLIQGEKRNSEILTMRRVKICIQSSRVSRRKFSAGIHLDETL